MGIKRLVKKLFTNFLPQRLKRLIFEFEYQKLEYAKFINLSFSQEGEDLILSRLFGDKKKGFYVDVGSHHPYRFSNTYKFYLLGWNGINIDPLPGCMEKFNKSRERDINLEIAVLNNSEDATCYYMFDEPALNSFNETVALQLEEGTSHKIINILNVNTYKLEQILDNYLPVDVSIDFLSIDVEGMDLEVLQSNNWLKYRPTYIIVESISSKLNEDLNSTLARFLLLKEYQLIGKTVNSLFFSNNNLFIPL